MARQRGASIASSASTSGGATEQELSSMYDYLAKIVLLGPSGCGKSCLLHRFVKDEWRVLTSQTIGVEFASKIVKVGTGARRRRIKLQLWDTAGTERFRSVSRSYYRNAAGAILVYDVSSHKSFHALPTFLHDARTLASPHLTVVLAGNKSDLAEENQAKAAPPTPSSSTSNAEHHPLSSPTVADPLPQQPATSSPSSPLTNKTSSGSANTTTIGTRNTLTVAPEGREVSTTDAADWSHAHSIATSVEVSAFTGEGVDELFAGLARTILTRIELGEIDPDDPGSGLQYGDSSWDTFGVDDSELDSRKRRKGLLGFTRGGAAASAGAATSGKNTSWRGLRDWEEVFQLDRRRRGRLCC